MSFLFAFCELVDFFLGMAHSRRNVFHKLLTARHSSKDNVGYGIHTTFELHKRFTKQDKLGKQNLS